MFLIRLIKKFRHIPYYTKLFFYFIYLAGLHIVIKCRPIKEEYWLILERGFDAQDNAWHFFRYLVKYHPELPVRYAICKESRDYESNLKGFEDKVVEYGTSGYYTVLFNSSVVISTHVETYIHIRGLTSLFQKSVFRFRGKFIFLQHGITRQECPEFEYPHYNIDLFVCGSFKEYELLNRLLHYPAGYIVYTGFPRYDSLLEFDSQKQVLIMPTWRKQYVRMTDAEFTNSVYFKRYREVLSNSVLIDTLRKNGYSIKFYNHIEFQKFNHCFDSLNNDVVQICQFGDKKVQDLLKESCVLITDYSSVYYDFLYMLKPVVFYHFDMQEFQKSQYGRIFDDFKKLGYVCDNQNDISLSISNLLNNHFVMEEKFVEEVSKVFKYRDTCNCKRVYENIIRKLSE